MAQHVLRVERSDSNNFVLLNVSAGTKNKLDVDIEGTEGTTPFIEAFKHNNIAKALSKNSGLSNDQWEAVAGHVLLQRYPKNTDEKILFSNIELKAHLNGNQLVLAFRKNISGIYQRIADLTLRKNEDHELDTIAWISTATQRSASLESEVCNLVQERDSQQKTITRLEQQLDQLVKAKNAHENELIEKFCQLLNSKKLKIRNQQRILADETKGVQIQEPGSERHETPEEATELPFKYLMPDQIQKRRALSWEKSLADDSDHDNQHKDQDLWELPGETRNYTLKRVDDELTTDDGSDFEVEQTLPISHRSKDMAEISDSTSKNGAGHSEENFVASEVPPRRLLPFGPVCRGKYNDLAELKYGPDFNDHNVKDGPGPGNIGDNQRSDEEL